MALQQKLDRKRSYGTVYGDPSVGFMQDELPYRHDGTLHPSAAAKSEPAVTPAVPTVNDFPTAASIATTPPQLMQALEALSGQIKELKSEPKVEPPKAPDPARSEAMRKIWVERRAREAAASANPEQP